MYLQPEGQITRQSGRTFAKSTHTPWRRCARIDSSKDVLWKVNCSRMVEQVIFLRLRKLVLESARLANKPKDGRQTKGRRVVGHLLHKENKTGQVSNTAFGLCSQTHPTVLHKVWRPALTNEARRRLEDTMKRIFRSETGMSNAIVLIYLFVHFLRKVCEQQWNTACFAG